MSDPVSEADASTANQTAPARVITPAILRSMPLPAYGAAASKNERGKLLVVAGSRRLPGTALLVARAALRTGCGTVRAAVPASIATALGTALPELMVLPLPETAAGTLGRAALVDLEEQYQAVQAIVIGPGLDEHAETHEVIAEVVAGAGRPMVVDASALRAFVDAGTGDGKDHQQAVLTPHDGEMELLTQGQVPSEGEDEAGREGLAQRFARTYGTTLVLKGRQTLIADARGGLYRNTAGTRGLGVAGSGDTLAGIIGSLLTQGLEPAAAAVWGVHLHALGGAAAAEDSGPDGLLASDVIERLPRVLRALRAQTGEEHP